MKNNKVERIYLSLIYSIIMKSDPSNREEKAERVEHLKEIEKKCKSKEKLD